MKATEKLIKLIEYYPMIYDSYHADYKKNFIKEGIWKSIAAEFKSDVAAIKRKWKSLRDSYGKYLRSQMPLEMSGPQRQILERYKTWPWAEKMEFLKPHLKTRSTFDNNRNNEEDAEEEEEEIEHKTHFLDMSNIDENHIEFESPTKSRMKFNRKADDLNSDDEEVHVKREINLTTNEVKQTNDTRAQFTLSNYDDIDMIFLGYAKTIKRFSRKRQVMLKFHIAELLKNEELQYLDEDDY